MIIALINNKGGVAKTTTAVNLSAALASRERRVLLIDLDSQAAASLSLGFNRPELRPSLAAAMFDNVPIQDVVRETKVEGLDLVTGSNELSKCDLMLANETDAERRLKKVLEPVRNEYAFIMIDCPTTISLLAVNALCAAEKYIVPLVPHFLAMGGLASLLEALEKVREEGTEDLAELMALVLTMVDYRNRCTAALVNRLRENLGDKVCQTEVRINVRLAEAPSYGMTIFEYDNGSTGAKAYRALADEILERCGMKPRPDVEVPEQSGAAAPSPAPAVIVDAVPPQPVPTSEHSSVGGPESKVAD